MSQAETPPSAATHAIAEGDPFQDEPMLGFRARSYRIFELVDDILHIGVAALLVVIAVIVFAHIILTGLSDLDVGNTSAVKFFDVVLNDINTILFVVIVLELLATVVAHLRERVFDLRPLLIIGVISSVRHILIVTAHMSADTEAVAVADAARFTEQIVELLVNTVVTLVLVLCLWYISRADKLLKRANPTGE